MTITQAMVERLFHKLQPLAQFHLVKQAYDFARKARATIDRYANQYDDYAIFATQAYRDLYVETGVALLLAEEVHCTNAVPLALCFLYDELKDNTSTYRELETAFGAEIAGHVSRLTPPFKQVYLYHPESTFYGNLIEADRNVRLVYGAYELYLYRSTLKHEYREGYPSYLREKLEYGVLPIARITNDYLTAELTGILETLQAPQNPLSSIKGMSMNTNDTISPLWHQLSSHLNEATRPLVERAYDLAAKAHKGQWRDGRDNAPYITHPLRVALILAEEGGRTEGDLLAVALLHDVLEDTDVKMEEMRDTLGADITNAVELLTKEEVPPGGKAARDSAYYAGIINGGEIVRLVKCADRLDNLRGIWELNDPERWQKYVKETRAHILPIAEMTNPALHEKLVNACSQELKPEIKIRFDLAEWGAEDAQNLPAGETLWAEPLGNNRFRLKNIPLYVDGIAFNDVVMCVQRDGWYHAEDFVEDGGYSTMFIEFVATVPEATIIDFLHAIVGQGYHFEKIGERRVAVAIPPKSFVNLINITNRNLKTLIKRIHIPKYPFNGNSDS